MANDQYLFEAGQKLVESCCCALIRMMELVNDE